MFIALIPWNPVINDNVIMMVLSLEMTRDVKSTNIISEVFSE